MRQTIVSPTPEFFPERFSGNVDALEHAMTRIALRIGLDADLAVAEVYSAEDPYSNLIAKMGLEHSWGGSHELQQFFDSGRQGPGRYLIGVESAVARDATASVATLARNLCHILLVDRGVVNSNEFELGPAAEMLSVFMGYGVFIANSVIRESVWQAGGGSGWSVGRGTYLDYETLGYSLARFARFRGESKPDWAKFLRPDARARFRRNLWVLSRVDSGL